MGGKVRIPLIDQGGGVNNWHLLGGAGFSPVLRGVNPPFPPRSGVPFATCEG